MKERSDGTGGIYQDSEGGWRAQIRYYDPFLGKSRTVRKRAKNRDGAREALKELRERAITAQPATSGMRIADYLTQYETNSLPTLGLAPATVELHRQLIANPLTPTLGAVTLADFDTATSEKWLARLRKARTVPQGTKATTRELSPSTQRKAFYALARALDVAARDNLIAENPLRSLAPPREGRAIVPTTSASDFDNLIVPAMAGKRLEPLVVLIGLTGCRLGEALGLRWADVDLVKATATFRRSGAATDRTKGGRVRTIPLVPEVVAALKARRKAQRVDRLALGSGWQNRDGLIFTTIEGRPLDPHNARRDFQTVLRSAGLPTTRPFHSLRHGLATRLLERGIGMHVVSAILGHSSIRLTVDTYGHVEPVMHAEALAAALGKS